MKEVCKVRNKLNENKQKTIENALIFNECTRIPKVTKAIEYLQKTDKNYSSENIVDNIIESSFLIGK